MGYTTKFSGSVKLSRPLTLKEAKTFLTWSDDRDSIEFGDKEKISSYLQWVLSKSLDRIGWDGNEKFYDYEKWMQFVCDWLTEIGVGANGDLTWSGESADDVGVLSVKDNLVSATQGAYSDSDFIPIDLSDLADMALEQATKE